MVKQWHFFNACLRYRRYLVFKYNKKMQKEDLFKLIIVTIEKKSVKYAKGEKLTFETRFGIKKDIFSTRPRATGGNQKLCK